MTSLQIQNMEAKSQQDLSKKDNDIRELERVSGTSVEKENFFVALMSFLPSFPTVYNHDIPLLFTLMMLYKILSKTTF